MDSCALVSLTGLIPTVDQVKTALSVIGSIVIAASMVTSLTPTPTAGSRAARAYRYLEVAALLFGRAKQTGSLPPIPKVDRALQEAVELAKGALSLK